jgi:hypothetical protein
MATVVRRTKLASSKELFSFVKLIQDPQEIVKDMQ